MGHPQALGEQHNQVWSYQRLAENGHQMTGHFLRGSGEQLKWGVRIRSSQRTV